MSEPNPTGYAGISTEPTDYELRLACVDRATTLLQGWHAPKPATAQELVEAARTLYTFLCESEAVATVTKMPKTKNAKES
jgi:hypothetical protein